MRNAATAFGIISMLLESRMMRKYPVRFGGGRSEKEPQGHLAGRLPN